MVLADVVRQVEATLEGKTSSTWKIDPFTQLEILIKSTTKVVKYTSDRLVSSSESAT